MATRNGDGTFTPPPCAAPERSRIQEQEKKLQQESIRNVAIIAHVDHGKTTLVDQLFKQGGRFRDNQERVERLMDSMDQERERGITITSKTGSFPYKGYRINIIDTPGHADFGGQVERVLRMADGCLLLVDAQEGPMPQTTFVVKKALAANLPIVLVVNKVDKDAARPEWAVDQTFDLLASLGAPDEILDFPVIYASAKAGITGTEPDALTESMEPLCEMIVHHFPPPAGDPDAPLQLQVNTIGHDRFLGRLGIGRVMNGALRKNDQVVVSDRQGRLIPVRVAKLFRFDFDQRVETDIAVCGDIVAVAGLEEITVGVTFTSPDDPRPLPLIEIDPPTITMNFLANDSPFAGQEGKFVTSRHLEERLAVECLADVALQVEKMGGGDGFMVSGRGELHLSVLIEKMRREGYEFQVTRPTVIEREEDGVLKEPFEELTLEMDEEYSGAVIEMCSERKGELLSMERDSGRAVLVFRIPTRGLLGFRSQFLTETRGTGVMNYIFAGYFPHAGEIRGRKNGVLVNMADCTSVAYALFNLQPRGQLFIGPGEKLYKGQIIGIHSRENDLVVNPAKGKKLTNVRAAGSDENVILTPPRKMSLEECLTFINDDELVEVTPRSIRLRKRGPLNFKQRG